MKNRLVALQSFIKTKGLDGIIITKPENRRYFSGFSGSAGMLLISTNNCKLITDFRYIEQATNEAKYFDIIRYNTNPYEIINTISNDLGLNNIGFESDFVTYDLYNKLQDNLTKAKLVPVQIDSLRMVKDDNEINAVKQAVAIADSAFSHIISFIRPGITELAVAIELENHMRMLGSEKPAFDTIVASGKRGALPHGVASSKIIETGDFVTMDFGAVYQGYHSDITRTICIGKANAKQVEIYNTVLKAQMTSAAAVKAGYLGRDIDSIARKIITDAGYGEYFGHGLGHGVGLVIHEEPRLSPTNAHTLLAENMLVTVEPGIYLPDWGGVRIEDTVLVGAASSTILTTSSKQLIEIN